MRKLSNLHVIGSRSICSVYDSYLAQYIETQLNKSFYIFTILMISRVFRCCSNSLVPITSIFLHCRSPLSYPHDRLVSLCLNSLQIIDSSFYEDGMIRAAFTPHMNSRVYTILNAFFRACCIQKNTNAFTCNTRDTGTSCDPNDYTKIAFFNSQIWLWTALILQCCIILHWEGPHNCAENVLKWYRCMFFVGM